jgi:hypothetical protein
LYKATTEQLNAKHAELTSSLEKVVGADNILLCADNDYSEFKKLQSFAKLNDLKAKAMLLKPAIQDEIGMNHFWFLCIQF